VRKQEAIGVCRN